MNERPQYAMLEIKTRADDGHIWVWTQIVELIVGHGEVIKVTVVED